MRTPLARALPCQNYVQLDVEVDGVVENIDLAGSEFEVRLLGSLREVLVEELQKGALVHRFCAR